MMIDFLSGAVEGLLTYSKWELVAVVLAVAYLLLAMRQSQWCWPAAFVSTTIYTVLFWESALLMESILSAYYLIMAVYGWWSWHKKDSAGNEPTITSWSVMLHIKVIIGLSVLSVGLAYVMDNYTRQDYAYLDTFTTVFAIFTTWMVTQKVLENWVYWLVIDAASIYLYIAKGFDPTALLYMFYCLMVVFGYMKWRGEYQKQCIVTQPQGA